MKRVNLYYRKPSLGYKFIPGDRYIYNWLRNLFTDKKVSGLDKVFVNLCRGFDELKVNYSKNLPFSKIKPGEPIVVLGIGKHSLKGYKRPDPVIAGIGLMTFPEEWPDLFSEYPVAKYLQHSKWACNVYVPYFGRDNCETWPAGIDTEKWRPASNKVPLFDLLIYNKIMWNKERTNTELKAPLLKRLDDSGLSYREITYGQYKEHEYFALLQQCRAMIFLCEHESQGFACCEAMSAGVPVFAWDQGYYLDPNRRNWNAPLLPASSVPFFDDRCGMIFKDLEEFESKFGLFWGKVKINGFDPGSYIIENLTLKKSAARMLQIIDQVYSNLPISTETE